jgi:hypothetical protein
MGFIDLAQLRAAGERMKGNAYGEYLLGLAAEEQERSA